MQWTDNPVRDAERCQGADRPCFNCVICDCGIYPGDDYFEIDDMEYCPDCTADIFKKEAVGKEYE